ncbi:MAG TPA: LON peptidase substrate-binding domain-containing protein [Opitutales bacterium]|nr:LON peptidase substrate-binding domain-containing protein [Opitutales bacterium]
MTIDLDIPRRLPVILTDTVFFPQAMLPLHIFEPHDRAMLKDVLWSHRMVAVRPGLTDPGNAQSQPDIATVGMIRSCRKNDDGTSNLVLQGICRIRCGETLAKSPYPLIASKVLTSVPGCNPAKLLHLKGRLLGCIGVKRRLGGPISGEILAFLKTIDEPDIMVDLAAYSLCDDMELQQQMLETLNTCQRLKLFIEKLRRDIDEIRLRKKLQGPLDDDEIGMN